jgi:hypothetical protein
LICTVFRGLPPAGSDHSLSIRWSVISENVTWRAMDKKG